MATIRTLGEMENALNNLTKYKNNVIAKLFLPFQRGYVEKIRHIGKNLGIDVIFIKR